MKFVFLLMLLPLVSMADSACEQVAKENYVDGWAEARSLQRISKRIAPDAAILCSYYPDREQQQNLLVMRERGKLEGVEYELHYADGSAVIQGQADKPLELADYDENWHLSCRVGGQLLCYLLMGDIVIGHDATGKTLMVGVNHRDGSDVLIRVSGQQAVSAAAKEKFSAAQTGKLLQQMRSGNTVDTVFHQHGKQRPTDKVISLYGFNQAMAIMTAVRKQLTVQQQVQVVAP